jgi:hypothetical protein
LPPIFMTVYGADDDHPGRQVRDYAAFEQYWNDLLDRVLVGHPTATLSAT